MDSNIEETVVKLKQLYQDKKQRKELRIYLEKIGFKEIENIIKKKCMTSSGLELVDILFAGLSNTTSGQENKLQIVKLVLKLLKKSESASHVNFLLTSIRLELPGFSGNSLRSLSDDCVESIRENDDPHTSWKDLLPECLKLISDSPGKVIYCDTEISGTEYSNQCIKSLCLISWDSSIIIPLATMFREIALSKEDHSQVVRKLCSNLNKLNPESLPPLLYQLLRLCREHNATIVLFRFSEYFSTRLYPELLPQAQDSESPDLDLIGAEHASESALNAHATCIQFAVGDSCIPRHVLATLKIAARRPSTLLSSPSLLHLLLSAESQRDLCLQIIKSTLTYSLFERQRREEFTWCADCLSVDVPLETLIKSLVVSSTKHCHLSTVGLLHLSTNLIASWGTIPAFMLSRPYIQLKSLGRLLFVRLGRACPNSIAQGLRLLMHTPQLLPDLLESLCINAAPMLMDCIPELRTIIEDCLGFQHDPSDTDAVKWRCRILHAVVPITTRASNLRDTFLIMCRKGLFSRDPAVGRVAVTGLLCLLKALRCSSEVFSQDFSNSEHSVLTQISIDVHSHNNSRSKVNNAAVCMEILSQLRICLNQNWEVREQLYKGMPNVISKRPELLESILEVLYEHISLKYVDSDSSSNIPILMDKCVLLKDASSVLVEAIGALLFCLQKVVVTSVQDCSSQYSENTIFSNKLAKMLQSFAEKFANKTPADFTLDDGIMICDILPESQSRCLIVQQLFQVCEALIAFCLQHWTFVGNETAAKTLQGLHKTYQQLSDFVKINSKGKKIDKNVSKKLSQKSQKEGNEKEQKKSKGKRAPMKIADMRKDHSVVFKPLDTVWDIDTVYRITQLLYSDEVEWTCKQDMTNLRTSRSLHRHFIKSCINSIKVSANLVHIGEIIGISKILYKHCVSRLDDFSDFDQETALLVTECFHELLSIICTSESNDKIIHFLTEICGKSELREIGCLITNMCETISSQITKTIEGAGDTEDPASSKLPPALLGLLTTLITKLPSNTAGCDKWTEYLIRLCSDGVKSEWVGSNIISSILTLSARSRNPWNAVEALSEALTKIMHVSDSSIEETGDEYVGVFSCLAHSTTLLNAAYLALCSHLNKRLGAAELIVGRIKAEFQAVLPYKAADHQYALASGLKNRERALCNELAHLVNVGKCVAILLCPPGACCTAALKLLGRLHSVLALTAQHFMTRDVTFLLHARFDRVVMSAGRRLSKSCDALIEHVEGARGDQKEGRSVVVRDTKHIPKMVYLMEQFAKRIMQLDKKTKLDLMSHMAKGSARDFKIKASTIHEALRKQNNVLGEDEDEEETILEKSDSEMNEESNEDIDVRSVEKEVEAVIQDGLENSENDDESKKDSDDDSSTNMVSDDEESNRPRKKKRVS